MIYPSADKLENWGSKYALVVLAAKRAKQIKSGAPPLIQTSTKNPLTIALEEIAAGKITCEVAENDLPLVTATEPEIAQLLAIPDDIDTDETPVSIASNDEDFEDWEEDTDEEEEPEEVPFGLLGIDEEEKDVVDELEALPTIDLDEPKPKGKKSEEHDIDIDDIDVDVDVDVDVDIIDDTEDDVEEE